MTLFVPISREKQLLQTVARKTRQGFSVDEQYAAVTAARDKRKRKKEKRFAQVMAGGWANIPIIRG